MKKFWGRLRRFLENNKLLWNLSNFIGPSLKWALVLLIVGGKLCESCPLSLVEAVESTPTLKISHREADSYQEEEGVEEVEGRVLSLAPPSTSSMLSAILVQVIKYLVRKVMGERWLSEEVALRRLDDLKKGLFNYYARRNLFGATVETARDKGIGFPSLEGALLSLAFLTFSVFLIDLIQTLLNRLRMRTAMMTPAPAAAAAVIGRGFLAPFSPTPPYVLNGNNSSDGYPISMETLTTLSSKVLSAIEKPWRLGSTSEDN